MRIKWVAGVVALVSVTVLTTAGVALASHVTQVHPATVPTGILVAHNHIADVPLAPFARAMRRDGTDVFVAHVRRPPGEVGGWHTHPGPVIVTIVSGSLTYEDAAHRTCQRTTYTAGEGFVDPGFGHVHRAIAGPSGADYYAVFILPAGSATHQIPAPAPAACV
ncbi:MAG: hypothetical protein ACRDJN_01090 [Chloroflexota bacterium]